MFPNELKNIYNYDRGQDMTLFNNKEILVEEKSIFISPWFHNNILLMRDLLNSNGQFMSYQEFTTSFPGSFPWLEGGAGVSIISELNKEFPAI